ncbi:NAD-dependent epimerase/dehydratase family protein [Natrinema versiforme]|uniref:NAD-dependent epimerase/dehydratase n=1 Tax=Natrinema versiforme JCM 10478 TaxID=1227496 RepID=L9Y0N2_9EURY|nr:NAD-dependent epimerase/dehydratase family protein [Natrinema versiforme]ELY67282.1 NAD-dependent epimerase/dehydratase [Natrinema versiforme JCM 10478]
MADPELVDTDVLITGGAGFIGARLAHQLVDDNDVTVLDDCSSGTPRAVPDDATLVRGDVRDEADVVDAMDSADIVFHEAALVSISQSVEDPRASHDRNVRGTLEVLEAARRCDARVVLASSAAIYGHPDAVPIPETHPADPTSPYGLDKLALDEYARLYHELYGLETVALRYFNVYGPGQPVNDYSGVINIFLERARNDDPLTVFGDGEQTRDFVHVDDIVRANVLAATGDVAGEAYNVGTGRRVTINELADMIVRHSESDAAVVHDEPREGDIRHSCADISKISEHLGYEPTISLEDGIRELVATEG